MGRKTWWSRVIVPQLVAAVFSWSISATAFGTTDSFINPAGGDWSNSLNWSPQLPATGDDAENLLANAPINFNTNATVNSFLSQSSDFNLLGGTLAGSQANATSTVQVNGVLTVNGGGLSNLTLNQGVGGSVSFAANGGNFISSVIIASDLTFGQGGFAEVYNTNAVSGNINMASTANGLRLHDGNTLLTLTSTLHGYGTVYENSSGGTLANNGTISADSSGNTLSINSTNLTGTGVLQAKNGGILSIGAVINGTGMQVQVDGTAGSMVELNGGGVTGTLGTSTGSGLTLANNGNNFISGATIASDLTFGQGGFAEVYSTNSVSGNINMASTANGLRLHDGNTLLTLTGTLHGYGTVYENSSGGTLANNGTISADSASNTLTINSTNLTGSGVLQAKNGGILSIGAVINGSGMQVQVDNTAGSIVELNGGGVIGTLGTSTGSGLTLANNGGNFISSATIASDLTLGQGGFAEVYSTNAVSGNINMASTANGLRLHDGNTLLTLTGTLHGYGTVYENSSGGTLANNGTISADSSGNTLSINSTNLTGSGILQAKNGGILSIGAVINGTGMQVQVDGTTGSMVELNGGGVTGTLGTSTGSGLTLANNGGNFISSATIASDLTLGQGGFAEVYNTNSVSGNINMASTANGLRLHDGNTLLTLTGTLHGYGTVFENSSGGTLANNGTISGDVSGQTLSINSTNLTGSGVLQAKNGGILSIGAVINGTGMQVQVDGTAGSMVELNGGGVIGTLGTSTGSGLTLANNGGNFISSATIASDLTFGQGGFAEVYSTNSVSGNINMASTANGLRLHDGNTLLTLTGTLHGFGTVFENSSGGTLANNGIISADVSGQTLALNNTFTTNNSSVTIVPGATLSVGGVITQNAGTTKVDGLLSLANTYSISGGSLTGTGTITGNIDNISGTTQAGDSPGVLSITGNYKQEHGAIFEELLGGAVAGTGYSQLAVSSLATLDGAIDVTLVNGFTPTIGEQFDVLLGSNTGTFSSTTSPDSGLTYSVSYLPDRVRITINTVPEPSSLALLATAGLLAFIKYRKRTGALAVRSLN